MGVYIKDLTLPKTCFECFKKEGCEHIPRRFTTEQAEAFCKGRPNDCPLVEIDDLKFEASMEILDKMSEELNKIILYGVGNEGEDNYDSYIKKLAKMQTNVWNDINKGATNGWRGE